MEFEPDEQENDHREDAQPSPADSEKSTLTDVGRPSPRHRLRPGTLFGRYHIRRELGSGGLGEVYLAEDPTLRRQVALKIMRRPGSHGSARFQRFAREAEAASALNHPNIVTVYEIGAADGIDYIALEYISGKSLRHNIPKHGLSAPLFFTWAIQICDALGAAHEIGLIHRDLKPANIMISGRGAAKIVDFGLARTLENPADAESLTDTGVALGTPGYMAPEQAEGKKVDARADIFSLGCVLYEMACGQRAFAGSSKLAILAAVMHKEPPPLQLPPGMENLESVIAPCLRKNPQERWRSAADLSLLLEQMRSRMGESSAGGNHIAKNRSSKIWIGASALALGIAAALAGSYLWRSTASTPLPAGVTTMLTTDMALATDPALSSDGRVAAYASDRGADGSLDIWLQQIGGSAPLRLTSDPADDTSPDFSPDGMRIAFRSERDGGGIYTMPSLGGDAVLLAQQGRNPKYSPDGKWVLYWVGRESAALLPGAASVFVIPSTGGQPRLISAKLAAAMYPVWSPDGKWILAVARRRASLSEERDPDWWTIPFESGGEPQPTGAYPLFRTLGRPAQRVPLSQTHTIPTVWRADGTVVFAAQAGDASNLFFTELDRRSRRAMRAPEQITFGAASETQAAFARVAATDRMAFSSHTLQLDLWSIPCDVETGEPRGGISPLTRDSSFEFVPTISSDGSRISYLTSRSGAVSLAVRDLPAGKERIVLTARIAFPQLSGDGRSITYIDADLRVMRVASNGGGARMLCDHCGTPTNVSYDGSRVLLEPFAPPEDVRSVDAAGGRIETLVPAKERLFSAKLSPDGRRVLFQAAAADSENSQIFVAPVEHAGPAPRSQWIEITDAGSRNQNAAWSPAGKRIYFQSDRDGFRCVYSRRLDSEGRPNGPIVALQHFHSTRRSLQALRRWDARTQMAITKDRVIVVLGEVTGNIWLRDRTLP